MHSNEVIGVYIRFVQIQATLPFAKEGALLFLRRCNGFECCKRGLLKTQSAARNCSLLSFVTFTASRTFVQAQHCQQLLYACPTIVSAINMLSVVLLQCLSANHGGHMAYLSWGTMQSSCLFYVPCLCVNQLNACHLLNSRRFAGRGIRAGVLPAVG